MHLVMSRMNRAHTCCGMMLQKAPASEWTVYTPAEGVCIHAPDTTSDQMAPCAAAGSEEAGYTLTLDFVVAMIEHFKAQKLIHKRFAFQILLQVCAAPTASTACLLSA